MLHGQDNRSEASDVSLGQPAASSIFYQQRVSERRQTLQSKLSGLEGDSIEIASKMRELAEEILNLERDPVRALAAEDALFIVTEAELSPSEGPAIRESLMNSVLIPALAYSREGRHYLAEQLTAIASSPERKFQDKDQNNEAFAMAKALGQTARGAELLLKILHDSEHMEAGTLLSEGLAENSDSHQALRQILLEHPSGVFQVSAALALRGREETLEDLIEATRSEYKPVAFFACMALEGEQRAQSALCEAALKSMEEGSSTVIQALRSLKGQKLSPAAVSTVIKILKDCDKGEIESLALEVLTAVPEAEDSLTELLQSLDHRLNYSEIALALRGTKNPKAQAALLELVQSGGVGRHQAAIALGARQETLSLLMESLQSSDMSRSRMAAEALSNLSEEHGYTDRLIGILERSQSTTEATNSALALTGNQEGRVKLINILLGEGGNAWQEEAAAFALAGSELGRKSLLLNLNELEGTSLDKALKALGPCRGTMPFLIQALASDNSGRRMAAVYSLAQAKDCQDLLEPCLEDRNSSVRFNAALALPENDRATRILLKHGLESTLHEEVQESLKQRPNAASILRDELEDII